MCEQKQFNNTCAPIFKEIKETLKSIDARLFHDNGTKSIQTRLNNAEVWQNNHEAKEVKFVNSGVSWVWIISNWHRLLIGIVAIFWAISSTISAFGGAPQKFTAEELKQIIRQVQTVESPVK